NSQSVAYTSSSAWLGLTPGTVIADADFGTPGNQPAIYGVSAFGTVTAALASTTIGGQVIVNQGTYAESVTLAGSRNLTITVGAAVTFDSVSAVAGTFVQIQGTSLTVGDSSNTTIAAVISGAGDLIKDGSGTLILSGSNTYTGATTIDSGSIA